MTDQFLQSSVTNVLFIKIYCVYVCPPNSLDKFVRVLPNMQLMNGQFVTYL